MVPFISPLQTVQMIPIFSYLNTLSGFLFDEKFLDRKHQNQPIPVVNALYHYFFDESNSNDSFVRQEINFAFQLISQVDSSKDINYKVFDETFIKLLVESEPISTVDSVYRYFANGTSKIDIMRKKKINLARKLINHTDLFGAKENETLDINFVDSLFKHIIISSVFDKYVNIYGFLAEIVNRDGDIDVHSILGKVYYKLSRKIFLNEDGSYSTLEPFVALKIVAELIRPLFPEPKANLTLISVDYIYAQAGAISLHSEKSSIVLNPSEENEDFGTEDEFRKYVTFAHVLEQSVLGGNISNTALKCFALPALLHYVYKEKEKLKNENIMKIIYNPAHWASAYRLLFSYINSTFHEIETAKNNDFRLQFHLAIYKFKNRTVLAKEMIESQCILKHGYDIDDEIDLFKTYPSSYRCNTVNGTKRLDNVNEIYENQVKAISRKFLDFERESVREAFGEDLIKSIDSAEVEISEGFFITQRASTVSVLDSQQLRKSDDMYNFYFPGNDTSVYYGLLRKGNDVILIRESDNPVAFRHKLGLDRDQVFHNRNFGGIIKTVGENFEIFLRKVTAVRTITFESTLYYEGYAETRTEWWEDFGLSLIPFYSCSHAVVKGNVDDEIFHCTLDALLLIPVAGEVGSLGLKFMAVATRSLLRLTGTTFMSAMLRGTIRESLSIMTEVVVQEAAEQFSKETFKSFRLSLIRLLDPGFELFFDIGSWGIKSLTRSMKSLEKFSTVFRFPSMLRLLEKKEFTILNFPKKVGTISGRDTIDVYVNCLSGEKDAGYGYKYVYLFDGEVAKLRKVREFKEEVLVLVERDSKVKEIYNPFDGVIYDVDYQLVNNVRHELITPAKVGLKSYHNTKLCGVARRKRSPTGCLRTDLQEQRTLSEAGALKYMTDYSNLSEETVRVELRKYIFPEGAHMQKQFVKDWLDLLNKGVTDLPDWSKQYKIKDPEMFSRLKYDTVLDKEIIEKDEAVKRIQNIFPNSEQFTSDIENSLQDFLENKAYESVSFEDYYALEYYMGGGYQRIGETSLESKAMREAMYRLAIRQSDDPLEEAAKTLYRGGGKHPEVVEDLFGPEQKEFEYIRFTSSSENEVVAKAFQLEEREDDKYWSMLYAMKFSEPYIGVRLESILQLGEVETVLLPGSKFKIDKVTRYTEGWKKCMRVDLSFLHDFMSKEEWYLKIMDELEKLKNYGAAPYVYDLPSGLQALNIDV